MSRPPGWTQDKLEAAITAYVEGRISVRGVKTSFGIPPTTLLRYLRERGLETRPPGLPGVTGADHPTWKGGSRMSDDGYVRTYAPHHPWPRRSGYVYEHVRVMELYLGRRVAPHESVHHRDHDRTNNARENLELVTRSAHSKHHRSLDIHRRQRDGHGRFS